MRFLIELFFLWIFLVSSLFSYCGPNILQHWRKKFRKDVKGAFYLNNNTFRGKFVIFQKILTFTIFSIFDEKLCAHLSERLPRGLENWFLHSFGGFPCITLSFSSTIFTLTNYFEGKCLEVGKKFFWHGGQNCSLCVQRRFLKKFFLFHEVFKFFSCFQTLRNYFQIFGENNLVGLSKVFSIVQGLFLE